MAQLYFSIFIFCLAALDLCLVLTCANSDTETIVNAAIIKFLNSFILKRFNYIKIDYEYSQPQSPGFCPPRILLATCLPRFLLKEFIAGDSRQIGCLNAELNRLQNQVIHK